MDRPELVEVCAVFNRHNVHYAVFGAHGCALHGHIRATQDIDLLLENKDQNLLAAIDAVRELLPDFPEKIVPADIKDNVVLKLIDRIELDLSISAWDVTYEDAKDRTLTKNIDGVEIRYLGLTDLIKSKQTMREIDMWDVRILKSLHVK